MKEDVRKSVQEQRSWLPKLTIWRDLEWESVKHPELLYKQADVRVLPYLTQCLERARNPKDDLFREGRPREHKTIDWAVMLFARYLSLEKYAAQERYLPRQQTIDLGLHIAGKNLKAMAELVEPYMCTNCQVGVHVFKASLFSSSKRNYTWIACPECKDDYYLKHARGFAAVLGTLSTDIPFLSIPLPEATSFQWPLRPKQHFATLYIGEGLANPDWAIAAVVNYLANAAHGVPPIFLHTTAQLQENTQRLIAPYLATGR